MSLPTKDILLGLNEFLFILMLIVYIIGLHRDLEKIAREILFFLRVGILLITIAFSNASLPHGLGTFIDGIFVVASYLVSLFAFIQIILKTIRGSWKALNMIPILGKLLKNSFVILTIFTIICGIVLFNWISWEFNGSSNQMSFDTAALKLICLPLIFMAVVLYFQLFIAFISELINELRNQINKISLPPPYSTEKKRIEEDPEEMVKSDEKETKGTDTSRRADSKRSAEYHKAIWEKHNLDALIAKVKPIVVESNNKDFGEEFLTLVSKKDSNFVKDLYIQEKWNLYLNEIERIYNELLIFFAKIKEYNSRNKEKKREDNLWHGTMTDTIACELLGVSITDDFKTINKKYIKIAETDHPSRTKSEEVVRKFKRRTEAYNYLKDRAKSEKN